MRMQLGIILFFGIVLAGGCGGGGGAATPASPPPPPPPGPSVDVGAATPLDANTGQPFTLATLGVAAGGDAIAVWQTRDNSGRSRVAARRYTAQAWSSVEFIDVVATASQSATVPRIAMNASGQAVVAWSQSDSAFNSTTNIINDVGSLWVRNFEPATGWGAAEALTPPTGTLPPGTIPPPNFLFMPDIPSVAINASGTSFVLWSRARDAQFVSNGHTIVFARRRLAGQSTWDAERVLDNAATEKREPMVIVDGTGIAQAVWRHYTSRSADPASFDVLNIVASRYAASSNTWQTPLTLAASVQNPSSFVDAAMIGADEAVVSWNLYRSATDDEVSLTSTYRNGSWGQAANLGVGYFPRLAAGGAGAVLINSAPVPATGRFVASARFYQTASGWSAPRQLDDPLSFSGPPVIAANVAGQAMTVWPRLNDVTGVPERLYANYFDGINWQATARTLAGSRQGDIPVDIKLDANGNAIVLWLNGTELWANRFAIQ